MINWKQERKDDQKILDRFKATDDLLNYIEMRIQKTIDRLSQKG